MRTLLPDPPPAEFAELLERRRRWGADVHDEVWEGVLHMNPAPHRRHGNLHAQMLTVLATLAGPRQLTAVGEFNLGEAVDYRVPDGGLHGPGPGELYNQTPALVLEVLCPGDETWEKLPFYAAHDVDEVVIVDPDARSITWLRLADGSYHGASRSTLLGVDVAEVARRISWPD